MAYDGTDYCGWQIQPNGITVEEVLNRKLSELTGEKTHCDRRQQDRFGSPLAQGNVAVFESDTSIPPERIAYALNRKLPEDIVGDPVGGGSFRTGTPDIRIR